MGAAPRVCAEFRKHYIYIYVYIYIYSIVELESRWNRQRGTLNDYDNSCLMYCIATVYKVNMLLCSAMLSTPKQFLSYLLHGLLLFDIAIMLDRC